MKHPYVAIILSLILCTTVRAEEVTLLAASATSSTPDSAEIACLLDDNCSGFWQPASADDGVDEGLYLQFEETFPLYSIDMTVEKNFNKPPSFQLYLNGKTTSPVDVVYLYETSTSTDGKSVTYNFYGRDFGKYQGSLQTDVKSVFIKFEGTSYNEKPTKPTIKSLQFYTRLKTAEKTTVKLEPVSFKLPKTVSATVNSTSILEPVTAYHPANLFDSRYDFAWSTDGKKTNGIGEKITLSFKEKQTIAGIYIWNGYQRSAAHFSKNGQVKQLRVSGDDGSPINMELKSKQGLQKISLSAPLKDITKLDLEIADIYKGSKYQDVLISELRLVDSAGNIILPAVQMPQLEIDDNIRGFVDKSWSVFLHNIFYQEDDWVVPGECTNKRIRLRSNGTFVIYSDYIYGASGDGSLSANILEGNWAYAKGQIRIFGKKYSTELRSSDYIKGNENKKTPAATLFQSYATIKQYSSLSAQEKDQVLNYLLKSRLPSETDDRRILYWGNTINGNPDDLLIKGKDTKDLLESLKKKLEAKDPYYIKSSVITDFLLPTSEVDPCSAYY